MDRTIMFSGFLDVALYTGIFWNSTLFSRQIKFLACVVLLISFNNSIAMEVPLFDWSNVCWDELRSLVGSKQELSDSNELIQRKNKRRKIKNKVMNVEEFQQQVLDLCATKCVLCKKEELKKQGGDCPECDTQYSGKNKSTNNHRLFMHWIKNHHELGSFVKQYKFGSNRCEFCEKELKGRSRDLSAHIITKHVCTLMKEKHEICKIKALYATSE